MSKLLKPAQAGTVESGDILITLAPVASGTGIQIELNSPTMQQYGEHIKKLIVSVLASRGIKDAAVYANEKGALDFTIEARVNTAVSRAIH